MFLFKGAHLEWLTIGASLWNEKACKVEYVYVRQ